MTQLAISMSAKCDFLAT